MRGHRDGRRPVDGAVPVAQGGRGLRRRGVHRPEADQGWYSIQSQKYMCTCSFVEHGVLENIIRLVYGIYLNQEP